VLEGNGYLRGRRMFRPDHHNFRHFPALLHAIVTPAVRLISGGCQYKPEKIIRICKSSRRPYMFILGECIIVRNALWVIRQKKARRLWQLPKSNQGKSWYINDMLIEVETSRYVIVHAERTRRTLARTTVSGTFRRETLQQKLRNRKR